MFNKYNPNERIPVFTDIKITELFAAWSNHDTNPKLKTREIQLNNFDNNVKATFLQCWLNFSHDIGRESLNVVPTMKLINWVKEHMLMIDYDRIYFSIVVFEDHFDLYVKYNLIIGSRFLGSFALPNKIIGRK